MTKECPQCKRQLDDKVNFCGGCGFRFAPSPAPAVAGGSQAVCPACRKPYSPGAKFCGHCSMPLTTVCVTCGRPVNLTAKFCPHCSQSLSPLGPATPATPIGLGTGKLPAKALVANRYSIVRLLGKGGMGAVYLANDNRFSNKLVAVKEMSTSSLQTAAEKQTAIDGFKREAQLLCTLDHRNIPKVTDTFEENGKQFLVMDYVDGETLEDLLDGRTGPFLESEVLGWAEQLCDVLTYLHGLTPPVIFRDLKPGNVMILRDMKTVKLIDFGIVRFFKPSSQTDTVKLGTPGYAPPEQYGKGGQSDARSDVYALGALLHHLLTLRDPGSDPFKFPSISLHNKKVSSHVDSAIAKAVQPRPADRWQTAHEFFAALQGPKAGQQTSLFPGPPPMVQRAPAPAPQGTSFSPPSLPNPPQRQIVNPPQRGLAPTTPARHGSRIAASFIDGLILSGIGLGFYLIFGGSYSTDPAWAILSIGASLLYYTLSHYSSGSTIGKKMTHLKVVRMDGSKLTFLRSLWRYAAYVVPVTVLGLVPVIMFFSWLILLIPLFNPDHRALHDYVADTIVIED